MADDFSSVTVTPPAAPVRDARRVKELVIRLNEAIPAVVAVAAVEADEEAGIEAVEAVAAVAAVSAGIRVAEIEIRYTSFSSTDENRFGFDNPRNKLILSGNVVSPDWTFRFDNNYGSNDDGFREGVGNAYLGYNYGDGLPLKDGPPIPYPFVAPLD